MLSKRNQRALRSQGRHARTVRGSGLLAALPALLLLSGCKDAIDPRPTYSCPAPGTVLVSGSEVPVAPNGYVTVGNQIVNSTTCEPYRFVGVSQPSFQFSSTGNRLGEEATARAVFETIQSWKANTVRIEVAQYYGIPSSRFYDPAYMGRVDRAIRLARKMGLQVLLALQNSDRGDPNYPGDPFTTNMHQPMPDVNHSVPFWRELANRYKDDGGILFEIFSEPYPLGGEQGFSNWEMWLNGGLAPADTVYVEERGAFQAVGMQQLYDVVRSTGAHNLVVISGTSWGYFLNGVPAHRVRGHNIVYAAHPWDFPGKQPDTWERDWAFLAATDPVIITEFGSYDCGEAYPRAVLDIADRLNLSWVAWAWVAPQPGESLDESTRRDPICAFPMLLRDWSGTPSRFGALVKSRLASY